MTIIEMCYNQNPLHKLQSIVVWCAVSIIIQLAHCQDTSKSVQCRTPNNLKGVCISIYDCENLLSILKSKKITQEQSKYLRNSQCKYGVGDREPFVCCQTTIVTSPNSQSDDSGSHILPEPGICGAEPVSGRIYGGTETTIYEFPWFVLLEYMIRNKRIFACGGTLINSRYVLTAAHCLVSKDGPRQLVSLRLGEYNTDTDVDCILRNDQNECADPPLEIGYDEIIVHENYQTIDRSSQNDIALIRLDRNIVYTDYIQPICLPKNDHKSRVGEILTATGFGRTLKGKKSSVKLKIQLPVFEQRKCAQQFKALLDIKITENQICAGGKQQEDTCDSDSGGPLMYNNNVWVQEGIVSVGNRCGLDGWPGVYTRVSKYMNWIRSKLR